MDTDVISAPEAARILGVSLPAVHRLLDRAGVPSEGRGSAREVAALAGVSPTTAAKGLERLLAEGLVSHDMEKTARGGVVALPRWRANHRAWDAPLSKAVRRATLPERPSAVRSTKVPRRFHHLFWNADVADLDAERNGAYIAGRMLEAADVAAWSWALSNIDGTDIDRALSRRGVPASARALVSNWTRHLADSADVTAERTIRRAEEQAHAG